MFEANNCLIGNRSYIRTEEDSVKMEHISYRGMTVEQKWNINYTLQHAIQSQHSHALQSFSIQNRPHLPCECKELTVCVNQMLILCNSYTMVAGIYRRKPPQT